MPVFIDLFGEVYSLYVRAAAPETECLVQMKHGDVAKVGLLVVEENVRGINDECSAFVPYEQLFREGRSG